MPKHTKAAKAANKKNATKPMNKGKGKRKK